MNLIALRITGTRSLADYLEALRTRHADDVGPLVETDEEHLANVYLEAPEATRVGHGRFDASFIAGDEEGQAHNLSKAERVLGRSQSRSRWSAWTPSRPQARGETA